LEDSRSNPEVENWVAIINRQRLAYLLYIRLRGYQVDPTQIESLRAEVRTSKRDQGPLEHELDELQDLLAFTDSIEANGGQATKATLYDRGPIKLRMRPERNHARPHFHIEYKREHTASYAADTLERLAGSIPRKYEEPVLAWAKENQAALLETWRRMNAGEDVRELVIARDA
jgi:hypothetical protein